MAEPDRRRTPTPTPNVPPPPALTFAPIVDRDLSDAAKVVLWALCRWAWGRKAECWPSNAQVAEFIGKSPRAVSMRVAELVRRGYLSSRMERSATGTYRVITMTERTNRLRLVEPGPGGGLATDCATPPDRSCATPPPGVARGVAQHLASESPLNLKEGEKETGRVARGLEGPGPRPPAEGGEPKWLNVDGLTPEDVAHWKGVAERSHPRDPMGRVARKILERIEKVGVGEPPGQLSTASRAASPEVPDLHDCTRDGVNRQEESSRYGHKAHKRSSRRQT